jgi:carbon-monoxide dehydrogenase medium subunit
VALPDFQYHQPTTLDDVCRIRGKYGGKGILLAGGTDLIVKMRNRELLPEHVISLDGMNALGQITETPVTVSIGSMCTVTQITRSRTIRSFFPALAAAADELGSPSVRNMGTVGGNIATASPAADLPPALIAYGATANLKSIHSSRLVKLETLFHSPGKTCIQTDEILVDLTIKKPTQLTGAAFFKLGNRNALQIAIINGASYMSINPQNNCIADARIVLGAVAPTVIRSCSAETFLEGKLPDADLFLQAGQIAANESTPIDDLRGSAAYRKDMVAVLTARTLASAWNQIRHKKELP